MWHSSILPLEEAIETSDHSESFSSRPTAGFLLLQGEPWCMEGQTQSSIWPWRWLACVELVVNVPWLKKQCSFTTSAVVVIGSLLPSAMTHSVMMTCLTFYLFWSAQVPCCSLMCLLLACLDSAPHAPASPRPPPHHSLHFILLPLAITDCFHSETLHSTSALYFTALCLTAQVLLLLDLFPSLIPSFFFRITERHWARPHFHSLITYKATFSIPSAETALAF